MQKMYRNLSHQGNFSIKKMKNCEKYEYFKEKGSKLLLNGLPTAFQNSKMRLSRTGSIGRKYI